MAQSGELSEHQRKGGSPVCDAIYDTVEPSPAPARSRLVVVGNGMVGHYFARRAQERGLLQRYDLALFGDEQHAAYDRVRLGELIAGAPLESLTLARAVADEQRLARRIGSRVVAVHRGEQVVVTAAGQRIGYEWLVLATGARPIVPQVPGASLPFVRVYRTADDANALRALALEATERAQGVVIVGGGLLGLELAEQVAALGARVTVVESGSHLLPRQLDARAAAVLRAALIGTGLDFHLERRVTAIDPDGSVRLSGGEVLSAGLVAFTAGVRPCDELARAAGLSCDLFGGIEVDAQLATSDPRIFAVGDCARRTGVSYGLVAPGYEMADVVIERLLGQRAQFAGMRPATRLKLASIEVFAMGESAFDGPDLEALVFHAPGEHRRLSLRDGRVVGFAAVGPYRELAQAQQAVVRGLPLDRRQRRCFLRNLPVWGDAAPLSIASWPDDAPVCSCTGVTSGALKRAFADGHCTLDALTQVTGAGSVCGSCQPLVSSLIAPALPAPRSRPEHVLAWLSAATAVLTLIWLLAPPIPLADTVRSTLGYDRLWRDSSVRQVTGFGLVSMLAAGSLFSLRKRAARLRWGSFGRWRVFHGAVSAAVVALATAHTGLRLGSNLNALLMAAFLTSAACGALAGFAAAFERSLPAGAGQRWRGRANRLHLYAAWPLPLLITFHVLKFYYF